jgi:hypothetical protein
VIEPLPLPRLTASPSADNESILHVAALSRVRYLLSAPYWLVHGWLCPVEALQRWRGHVYQRPERSRMDSGTLCSDNEERMEGT